MKDIFAEFAQLLRKRFGQGAYTTEDSIRYTFFAALLAKSDFEAQDVVLEYPHPQIPGAEVDTLLTSVRGAPVAIEFKYDRQIPSGHALPRPQNAGELFKDMSRLAQLRGTPDPLRLLVYCTDSTMATYFKKPANGHTPFFNVADGERVTIDAAYIASKPATFRKSLGSELRVELTCRWSEALPNEHQLRVYEVVPAGRSE